MKITQLIATAALSAASLAAQAAPISVFFLGYDGNNQSVMNNILGTDTRFNLASSSYNMSGGQVPTLAALKQYDSVLLWTNSGPNNAVELGNVLADYVDAGGHLVMATFVGQTLYGNGRIFSTGYSPFTQGYGDSYSGSCLGTYDAASTIMAGVNSLCANVYRGDWTANLDTGASLVASWNDGRPMVGLNASGNVIDISLFPNVVSYGHASGNYAQLFRNALAYEAPSADLPEPATAALLGLGVVGLMLSRRKQKQAGQ